MWGHFPTENIITPSIFLFCPLQVLIPPSVFSQSCQCFYLTIFCCCCCAQFPVMYSSPPHPPPSESMRDTEHVWGLLCHVTSIYFLKEKKRKSSHSLNYEDNSNLKFCCWFYIFSFQQCTVIKKNTQKKIHTFVVVGLEFQWLCSTCCIETFQTNETHTHTHTKFSSWCCNFFLLRLFYPVDPSCSTRVTVAVIEKPPWNHSLP